MSKNVKQLIPLLKILNAVPAKVKKSILKNSGDELIKAISEICLNFCKGNVRCNKKCLNRLKKFKSSIHKLAAVKRSQKNLTKERKVLIQQGGAFLPILLPPILSALTQYLLQNNERD